MSVAILSPVVFLVRLPALQSETWLVHAKVREPHLNPLVRMNFPGFSLENKGSSYEAGGSDVVRELLREPAMFQVGVQGEVLIGGAKQVCLRTHFRAIA